MRCCPSVVTDILFKIFLGILCHFIWDFPVIPSLLRDCFEAYPFKCHGTFLFFLGISRSLFSWRFSITLSYRYDITLAIGFLNVLNGTFIPGFSMLSGIFRVNRVFDLAGNTLSWISVSLKWQTIISWMSLGLLLVVLIELYKNISGFFTKRSNQDSVDIWFPIWRYWSRLSNREILRSKIQNFLFLLNG